MNWSNELVLGVVVSTVDVIVHSTLITHVLITSLCVCRVSTFHCYFCICHRSIVRFIRMGVALFSFRCILFPSFSIASLSHSFCFLSFSLEPFSRFSFSISIVYFTEISFENDRKMVILNETLVNTALELRQIRRKPTNSISSFFSLLLQYFSALFELSLFNEQCSKENECMPF